MNEKAHYKSYKYPGFQHNDKPCTIVNRLAPLKVDVREHGIVVTHVVHGVLVQFKDDAGKYLVNIDELPGSPTTTDEPQGTISGNY